MRIGKNAINNISNNCVALGTLYDDSDFQKDVDCINSELDVLHCISQALSDKVLDNVLPYESAKVIKDYIKGLSKTHPEIKQTIEKYGKLDF